MREAIQLASNGFPAPNPHVGCVIVRDRKVVGRGFHQYAGGPHAEAVALAEARELAWGADAYVTLEPCNHTGRTPPCSQALITAGIKRVFIANKDPNPVAAGGAETLRKAGIEVAFGLCATEAEEVNHQFLESIRLKRPIVTVKTAMSLDGRIASASGESKWITGPEARIEGHRLRAECGSVLVGYRTVLADDPELTARIEGVINPPVRIVIDPDHKLTGRERVFNDAAPTLHLTGRPFNLEMALTDLFAQGIRGVLVEGGAGTIQRFVSAKLVDSFQIFVAPILIGEGLTWTGGLRFPTLAESCELTIGTVRRFGEDIRISAKPRETAIRERAT